MRLLTCKDSSGVTVVSESKVLSDTKLCTVSSVMAQRAAGWRGGGDQRREKI